MAEAKYHPDCILFLHNDYHPTQTDWHWMVIIMEKENTVRVIMITIQRKPIRIVLPNRQFIRWQHLLDRLTTEILRQFFYIFPMAILDLPGDQIQWIFP